MKIFKKIALVTFCLIMIISKANSQKTVEYKIVSDNPDNIPNNYIYWYYFDYQSGINGLGTSLNSWYHVSPKIIAEASLKFDYFGDSKALKKFPLKLSGGVAFTFKEKKKIKNVKVNVSSFKTKVAVEDEDGNFKGYVDAIGVNQIIVPGTYKFETSVHGGLEYQNGTIKSEKNGLGTFNSLGVYAGIVRESKVGVNTQIKDRIATSNQYIRMYADVMVFPVANTTITNEGKKSFIGFRAGAVGSFPGMKNFINFMTPKVEIGYHVYTGIYFQVGFGVDILRWGN
jgi:hypothetical protein